MAETLKKLIQAGVGIPSKITTKLTPQIKSELGGEEVEGDNFIFQDGNNFVFQDGNNFIYN